MAAASVAASDDEQSSEAPQFQRIMRRLSLGGHTGVAQEFKPFSLDVASTIMEEDPAPLEEGEELPGTEGDSLDVGAEEEAVREAEAEFVRRQSVMARNIRDYGRTITLKEERLKELEVRKRSFNPFSMCACARSGVLFDMGCWGVSVCYCCIVCPPFLLHHAHRKKRRSWRRCGAFTRTSCLR